jgi:proteic killer suppression protein
MLSLHVIQSFRHEGLARFFESGSLAGIQPPQAKRLRMLLAALHALKVAKPNRWSVWVNGNWRLTFEFRDGHAYLADYEDYH